MTSGPTQNGNGAKWSAFINAAQWLVVLLMGLVCYLYQQQAATVARMSFEQQGILVELGVLKERIKTLRGDVADLEKTK